MVWVNGELSNSISLSDRSFQYGDGTFTTALVRNAKVVRWNEHRARLIEAAGRLSITPPDWSQVEIWLQHAIASVQPEDLFGIKILISRGSGGRGYSPCGCHEPVVVISYFSYPTHYADWHSGGVELGICQRQLGLVPMLAGIKHNNRLEQVLLKTEMDEKGFVDGLVKDMEGYVCETTMANLIWRRDDVLFSPRIDRAGVDGITYQIALNHAKTLGFKTVNGRFTIEDLLEADEVLMTNAVLGIAPVRKIEHHTFSFTNLAEELRKSYMSC
ncbi:aminodeoxychorismate lyase [Vibrio sp. FNV 38]|nr:aminodeoxychorismate lyase [Vibrio sp. FNV 38]